MFFKLFTSKIPPLESRSLNTMQYGNATSVSKPYLYEMTKRDPVDPKCGKSSISLPDWIGKIFHPNVLSHEVIAAFALDAIADARADILRQGPVCPIIDKTTCYSGSVASSSNSSVQFKFEAELNAPQYENS